MKMYGKGKQKILSKQDKLCMHKRTLEALSRNHCCNGKAISIKCVECVTFEPMKSDERECTAYTSKRQQEIAENIKIPQTH
jgi:hypothetical protein